MLESVDAKADAELVRTESAFFRQEVIAELAFVRSEVKSGNDQLRAAISETKLWAIGIGGLVVTALSATKYFG